MKIVFLLILLSINSLYAEDAIKELSLRSEDASYQLDSPFDLKVNFKLNPGWHIYYKEPGKFGLPTQMILKSDAKLSFKEWSYPNPKEFKELTGDITLGYEDEVSFSLKVTPLQSTDQLDLEVFVEWLACNNQLCVPGEKTLKLTLNSHP